MTHLAGHDRSQALLLSETLANYVSAENPVRFIAASVEGLDLAACGFARVQPKTIGRSGYAPSGLLKLSIYASMGVRAPVGRQLQGKVSKGSAGDIQTETQLLTGTLAPQAQRPDFRAEENPAEIEIYNQP